MPAENTVVLWKDIYDLADKVCREFGLKYGKIIPEVASRIRFYGECVPCARCSSNKAVNPDNCKEKELSIRVHQLKNPKKPLATSTILDTLAHEMAHLRYMRHGKEHAVLTKEILTFMKGLR